MSLARQLSLSFKSRWLDNLIYHLKQFVKNLQATVSETKTLWLKSVRDMVLQIHNMVVWQQRFPNLAFIKTGCKMIFL